MKATEQYFLVVLFITLYKVALTFDAVDKILKNDHSHESYWAVLSCGAVCYGVQGSSSFESVDKILKCDHSNENCWAVLSWYVVQFIVIVMYKVILIFESVNETLRCDLSNENLGILPFTWNWNLVFVCIQIVPIYNELRWRDSPLINALVIGFPEGGGTPGCMWGNWALCGNFATNMNFYGGGNLWYPKSQGNWGTWRGDWEQVVFSLGWWKDPKKICG